MNSCILFALYHGFLHIICTLRNIGIFICSIGYLIPQDINEYQVILHFHFAFLDRTPLILLQTFKINILLDFRSYLLTLADTSIKPIEVRYKPILKPVCHVFADHWDKTLEEDPAFKPFSSK